MSDYKYRLRYINKRLDYFQNKKISELSTEEIGEYLELRKTAFEVCKPLIELGGHIVKAINETTDNLSQVLNNKFQELNRDEKNK